MLLTAQDKHWAVRFERAIDLCGRSRNNTPGRRVEGTKGDRGDVIVYRLPSPDDGRIGPCQQPVRWATGLSSVSHHTVSSPFITRTSTMSALAMVRL